MNREEARQIITTQVKDKFGTFLSVREVNSVRKAFGRAWAGELYCSTKEGDVKVGVIVIGDSKDLIELPDVDEMVDALVSARISTLEPHKFDFDTHDFSSDDEMDFSDLCDSKVPNSNIDSRDELDNIFDSISPDDLQNRINGLIATGEKQKLEKARGLLPGLLVYQNRRSYVLHQMAELEFLLGEYTLGIRHLEASAREYADIANLDGLSMVVQLASGILNQEEFDKSPIKTLFNQTRLKLRPLDNLKEAPLFVGLGDEELFALEGLATQVELQPGEILLKEGILANMAFIIKSGTLSIRLESPDGTNRIIRSCFPGDFIGESSILGQKGATCTATVQGEMHSMLWQFTGKEINTLSLEYPEIKIRIESAKTLHQLDSFISMNESTSSLDVSMRDQLLECIIGIKRFSSGQILNKAGKPPAYVYLIVNGQIVYQTENGILREYEPDTFAGLRDALHELPLEGEFVAQTDCLLVIMDPDKLKNIAQNANPEVIAVLEKLE